ncbi:MAG: aquaporin [Acidimicrobiales bacterium]
MLLNGRDRPEVRALDKVALWRRLVGEFVGAAALAAVVIGSGIAAQQLSPGAIGLELLESALVTGAGLFVITLIFAPVSGAHLNPVVSIVDTALGHSSWSDTVLYVPTQFAGCIGGAVLANLMFSKAAVSISVHRRASGAHFLSEVVATLGLVLVIFALARTGRGRLVPAAVGAYIAAAYFFTSSTSFANPAITAGRMFSNTFAGIAPGSVLVFIAAQVVGGALGFGIVRALYPQAVAEQGRRSEQIGDRTLEDIGKEVGALPGSGNGVPIGARPTAEPGWMTDGPIG